MAHCESRRAQALQPPAPASLVPTVPGLCGSSGTPVLRSPRLPDPSCFWLGNLGFLLNSSSSFSLGAVAATSISPAAELLMHLGLRMSSALPGVAFPCPASSLRSMSHNKPWAPEWLSTLISNLPGPVLGTEVVTVLIFERPLQKAPGTPPTSPGSSWSPWRKSFPAYPLQVPRGQA